MSANDTKNDQDVLVCHVDASSFGKEPVSKIPSDLPQWKQELLRKKEKEKMEQHKAEMKRLYEESQTPEWMRPLKKLHQRRKSEQSEKEEAERRKADEEKQRFEAMPAWKKQLIYKKRAKSADNLLAGCDVKNLYLSGAKESKTATECKANENRKENGDVNAEFDVENENGISDQERFDDDTTNQKVEKEDEQDKESEGVENTREDGEQVFDFGGNEDEITEGIDDADDNVDIEQREEISEENENHHSESATESSHNPSEGDVGSAISNDNEEDSNELEEGQSETGEQQVEARSEPAEEINDNKE